MKPDKKIVYKIPPGIKGKMIDATIHKVREHRGDMVVTLRSVVKGRTYQWQQRYRLI